MTILLDPGHGNNTLGKRSPDGRFLEYKFNRIVASSLNAKLISKGLDSRIIVPEEEDIPLTERCRRINTLCRALGISNVILVSIHANAAGNGSKWMNARGWSCYTSPGKTKADELATCMYSAAADIFKDLTIRRDFSDGDPGNLILSPEEKEELIRKYPSAEPLIRRYISSEDFIQNKMRYCLWLKGVSPAEYRSISPIMERIEAVARMRENSPTASVRRDAEIPMLFTQIRQPESNFLVVPEVSSQRRKYIPIGYLTPNVVASNKLYLVPDANLYLFGVIVSVAHMGWMRIVAGRLKSDYSYSPAVYNNFPWPDEASESQKKRIEETAQSILDARAIYPDSSLADLYDELTMPAELRKAHRTNDAAVLEAYGFPRDASESDIVARLFKMYQELTK